MKIRYGRNTTKGTDINVIPLLDVVFSILAFFILLSAGLVAPSRLGVDLPQSNRNNINQLGVQDKDMLVVTLDTSGQTRINNKVIASDILEREVRTYINQVPQGLVVLNAEDRNVSYQLVINKLEDLRRIAGNRVAIATSRS